MKKQLLLATLALTWCINLQAKDNKVVVYDELIIMEGCPDFLYDAGAVATFNIDIPSDQCIVVEYHDDSIQVFGTIEQYNESRGDDWVKDWPKVVERMDKKNGEEWQLLGNKKYFKMLAPQPLWILKDSLNHNPKLHKSYSFVDDSMVKYDILLHLDTLDMGNTAASMAASMFSGWATTAAMVKKGGAIGVGTLYVRERATGEIICQIKLNRLKGHGEWSESARLSSLTSYIFIELDRLLKAEKKNKKKK